MLSILGRLYSVNTDMLFSRYIVVLACCQYRGGYTVLIQTCYFTVILLYWYVVNIWGGYTVLIQTCYFTDILLYRYVVNIWGGYTVLIQTCFFFLQIYCCIGMLSILVRLRSVNTDMLFYSYIVVLVPVCCQYRGGYTVLMQTCYFTDILLYWYVVNIGEVTQCKFRHALLQIYCCIGMLSILGRLHSVNTDMLGWWLCERQLPSGGLNGMISF